jgi:hypothetical protein
LRVGRPLGGLASAAEVLPHEDTSMMQNFLILDTSDPSRH